MTSKFIPNQYEFLGKKLYVAQNNPRAGDANPGTLEKPLKTITAAMNKLKMGDHIYIDEGIYREQIPLSVNGHYYVPNSQVHFHAVEGKEVYIKGSDVLKDRWQNVNGNVWQTNLPSVFFKKDAYNPCRLALPLDIEKVVRPCNEDNKLPKTKGQIYVDGQAYQQVESISQVQAIPNSFIVSANGKKIIVNFGSISPEGQIIELTVRKRCIAPEFTGKVMIQTHGICIEHAAEPGPFCKDRPQSIRTNTQSSGVKVIKEFNLPGAGGAHCSLMPSQISYMSTEDDTLVSSFIDDTHPQLWYEVECLDVISTNGGRTWIAEESTRISFNQREPSNYSLDEKNNILMRHWIDNIYGKDPHGAFGDIKHNTMFQFSRDGGKTWSDPRIIDNQKIHCLSISILDDGSYILPYYKKDNKYPEDKHHLKVSVLLGRFDSRKNDICWEKGGEISVAPSKSNYGLGEPSVAQFPDGRLIMFFRAGSKLPSQDTPGATSIKLFSISTDCGETWSKPTPLCYDNGKYIYSPRAYHIAFRSIKNNKVYIAMNIADEPCVDCDPRTYLYLLEINPETLTAPRGMLTLIEAKHPEHDDLVRFSNFQLVQERKSKNPLIFMKLDKSEFCMIGQGYDVNQYRYEICLQKYEKTI